ncbi:MAG: SRPBCC family protein [Anaeromyxobacteraceae bacterium]
MKNPTTVERKGDRELVLTRTFDHPAQRVFDAWTRPELFTRWWVPKSFGLNLLSCEMDARVGGKYRLVFRVGESDSMAFFGTYVEVVPRSRLQWTNEEGGENGPVTTVTFEERDGRTAVVMTDRHPSRDALDAAIASGSTSGAGETFDQLDELLGTPGAAGGR